MLQISESGYIKITWAAAGTLLAMIISVVLWLASVDSRATDALQRLDRQKDAIKEMRTSVGDIDRRTIRMETILNEIKEKF